MNIGSDRSRYRTAPHEQPPSRDVLIRLLLEGHGDATDTTEQPQAGAHVSRTRAGRCHETATKTATITKLQHTPVPPPRQAAPRHETPDRVTVRQRWQPPLPNCNALP